MIKTRTILPRSIALILAMLLGRWCHAETAPHFLELARRVERLLANSAPSHKVGICVRQLSSGEILYQRGATSLYELASNTKLLTTSAALHSLGGDYGFVTRLYARGELDYFGNLDGDIVIAGLGEPSIKSRLGAGGFEGVVERWVASIREGGIRSVMGNIVVEQDAGPGPDNSLGGDFDEEPEDEEAEDDDGETQALMILITPGPAAGKRANLSVRPAGSSLRVINSCFTVPGTTRQVKVTRSRSGSVVVNGKVGLGAGTVTHILAYGHSGLEAASRLRESLPRSGVPVLGDVTLSRIGGPLDASARLLTESRTEFQAALAVVNKESHNQLAEEILQALGSRFTDDRGGSTHAKGLRVVSDFLVRQGISAASFTVADGSGLSHQNRMTPEALSYLLATMASRPDFSLFKDSLARPGEDGTLQGRLEGIGRYGRIAAKTGHISGVNTLSGYIDTRRGAYAFSLLTNGRGRASNWLLDAIAVQLASSLAVWDGSIDRSGAAPEPSYRKAASSKKSKRSSRSRRR